jgi:hypothetical protein
MKNEKQIQRHHSSIGPNGKNALYVGLINGDFSLWFDEWRLLPMV